MPILNTANQYAVIIIILHSYNDEGICFSKETDLGMVMERKIQVETFNGGLIIYTL